MGDVNQKRLEEYSKLRTVEGESHEAVREKFVEIFGVAVEEVEQLREEWERRTGEIREVPAPRSMQSEEVRAKSPWYFLGSNGRAWRALRTQLVDRIGEDATKGVDRASDKILSLMDPPWPGHAIGTRGMVLGYVQSGKTTSFTSVAAKAADAKYRLIVVLAGVHDTLREQTQDRLYEELAAPDTTKWWSGTIDTDFRGEANPPEFYLSGNRRALLVVKKNVAPLRKLNDWLDRAGTELREYLSILVIDDEADQASIDVGGRRPSAVHEQIRRLLAFEDAAGRSRVAYIGYTATPYANLLINTEDEQGLYPRDFIVDLDRPDGYFGPERIFGREALPDEDLEDEGDVDPELDVLRRIPLVEVADVRPTSGDDLQTWSPVIAGSLENAIRWFLLATSARRVLEGSWHNSSMLIHTTVRVMPQCAFKTPVERLLNDYATRLTDREDPLWTELRIQWEDEQDRVRADDVDTADGPETAVSWDRVAELLLQTVNRVDVLVDNSTGCSPRLEYPDDKKVDGISVIAVGGNTLSRGLTLEGLVTSYFVRSTSAYDTLMQMGRWFGFRPGYGHLQRVWMTDELASWFCDLATVEAELRQQIDRMESERLTPQDYALRIRDHPLMMITRAAAMRSAIRAKVAYKDARLQTTRFRTDDAPWLRNNLEAARRLIEHANSLQTPWKEAGTFRWIERVPYEWINEFLGHLLIHNQNFSFDTDKMRQFIEEAVDEGELVHWNVGVISSPDENTEPIDLKLPDGPVHGIVRSRLDLPDEDHAYIKALMSPGDNRRDMGGAPCEGGVQWRGKAEPGLLVLYPIDRTSRPRKRGTKTPSDSSRSRPRRKPLGAVESVLGVGIIFPDTDRRSAVSYVAADLSKLVDEIPDDEMIDDEDDL